MICFSESSGLNGPNAAIFGPVPFCCRTEFVVQGVWHINAPYVPCPELLFLLRTGERAVGSIFVVVLVLVAASCFSHSSLDFPRISPRALGKL